MKKQETDKIYNLITNNNQDRMDEYLFNQAINYFINDKKESITIKEETDDECINSHCEDGIVGTVWGHPIPCGLCG